MSFEHLSYKELIKDFFEDFLLEYGRLKFEKIDRKVKISKKISGLIYLSKQKMVIPRATDFVYCVNGIPFFMFSKAETIALGSLLSLERWEKECNNYLRLANEHILKQIAIEILQECKKLKFK